MSMEGAKRWWHCDLPGLWLGEYVYCRECLTVYGQVKVSTWGEPYLAPLSDMELTN